MAGVRLRWGDSLLFDTEIPTSGGSLALAGLNGAGKSLVLAALKDVFLRRPPRRGRWELLLQRPTEVAHELPDAIGRYLLPPKHLPDSSIDWVAYARDEALRILSPELPRRDEIAQQVAEEGNWALICSSDGLFLQPAISAGTDGLLRRFLIEASESFSAAAARAYQVGDDDNYGAIERVDGAYARTFYVAAADPEDFAEHGIPLSNPFLLTPGSLPLPLHPTAVAAGREMEEARTWPFTVVDVDDMSDVATATGVAISQFLAALPWQDVEVPDTDDFFAHPWPMREPGLSAADVRRLDDMTRSAGEIATSTLHAIHSPDIDLYLQLKPIEEWPRGEAADWIAVDKPSGLTVPLSSLSRSQQRWALYSIGSAVAGRSQEVTGSRLVVIIDEPEIGLHRAAERALAQGIRKLPDKPWLTVMATHSPAMIASADRTLLITRSNDARGRVDSVPLADDFARRAHGMGLNPSDVLGWHRLFVLAEGEHDEIVIERFLGGMGNSDLVPDILATTRARLVGIGGVKGVSATLTSSLLLDFTDVPLLVVVDGMGASVEGTWRQLVELAVSQPALARRRALSELGGSHYEKEFLRSALLHAVDSDRATQLQRIHIFSFTAKDCSELLPVTLFRPDMDLDWTDLRAEWGASGSSDSFKKYVKDRHGIRINSGSLRRALEQIPDAYFPEDMTRLANVMRELTSAHPE